MRVDPKSVILRTSRGPTCDFWHRIRLGLIGAALILFLAWVI